MRKPVFAYAKNKDAFQLRSNHAADQHLCFHYMDSTIPLLPISEIYRFVSDLAVNPKDRFFHDMAQY